MSFVERRRSRRVDFPYELSYRDRNKSNQGFKHAYGRNLSEHGLLFETYENFPQCTILEIKLEIPSLYYDQKEIFIDKNKHTPQNYGIKPESIPLDKSSQTSTSGFSILAEVVRIEEVKKPWLYRIGVSFCKIDDSCRKAIRGYTVGHLAMQNKVTVSVQEEFNAV